MVDESFFLDAWRRFDVTGPSISELDIEAAFPESFPGKDDLLRFYLGRNGGSRTQLGGTVYRGNPAHKESSGHLGNAMVEGFFSITRSPGERVPGLRSMVGYHASRLKTFSGDPSMTAFLQAHKPIAFDDSGNDFWIDLRTGNICFMDWRRYREGPTHSASSFREFVAEFWM